MNKIIIDNRSDLTDFQVLMLVSEVVSLGRISNVGKQYCYLSTKEIENSRYQVCSDLNEKSDRFIIIKE